MDEGGSNLANIVVGILVVVFLAGAAGAFAFSQYKRTLRESKNYERGLKMIPILIHLPPSSDDIEAGSRDQRDLTEEVLSQGQVMYNIIASTAVKGFKSKVYGQRHVSFEMISSGGLVYYYAVVPSVLVDVVQQAVAAAYPSSRLEEVTEHNIFSRSGKMSGTTGGEFTLKKDYVYPIATFQESKRDASRALLNALSGATKDDGVAIQIMIRPAREGWAKKSLSEIDKISKNDNKKKGGLAALSGSKDLLEALWKPPTQGDKKEEDQQKPLSTLDQAKIEAISEKTRHPGYEVLIRVVVSSNTVARSQVILKNVVAAFSLFDSQTNNGFKFSLSKNIEDLVTAYIFRFFPQEVNRNILNSLELATVFHLPDQSSIPTSQVRRQMNKQVDGPTELMDEGFLLGYNEFRGVKKPIHLSTNDRRRHTYIIGQTGTGKSVLLENLAYQDMHDGRGFAFVDPHGDSVEALLGKVPKERVEDVIYFNPGDMSNPIGLNMFEFDDPDQKDFLVQEAINMLYGLYDPGHTGIVGPRLEHIFRNCALLLMSDPKGGTFIDIPKVLVDPAYMRSKLQYVTDQTVLDFWTKEFPASQRSNEAGEVVSWVVSKFGPFISNDAMRNIIGQTKSGFNLRDIMDNKKILLVNLSKGRMGELNSKLLGIIFVMKFQAAAMGRADTPEDQRTDFSLYVDEFQNFATESFESILSEARKYRLNLVLGNQFMTQLTDKIREAIIGNVGTVIAGRIGITDAEILIKKFTPTFDTEDLTKMPNYQSISSVMINNVPSAPFSMSFVAPMGQSNQQLSDALKKLSAAKYGKPRAIVERDIFGRLDSSPTAKTRPGLIAPANSPQSAQSAGPSAGASRPSPVIGSTKPSFLDEWMAKRQQLAASKPPIQPHQPPAAVKPAAVLPSTNVLPPPVSTPLQPRPASLSAAPNVMTSEQEFYVDQSQAAATKPTTPNPIKAPAAVEPQIVQPRREDLALRGDSANHEDEVHISLR